MTKCAKCGVENKDEAKFCMSCGSALQAAQTPAEVQPVPPPPSPPPPRRQPQPDPLDLVGFAFLLVIVGIVFLANPNVFTQLYTWLRDMGTRNVIFRPPEGLIVSSVLFWSLASVSSFAMAFLRLAVQRVRMRAVGDAMTGVAQVVLATLLFLYSGRVITSSEVISVEAVAVGVLLFVYVAVGLVYGFGKRAPVTGVEAPSSRP